MLVYYKSNVIQSIKTNAEFTDTKSHLSKKICSLYIKPRAQGNIFKSYRPANFVIDKFFVCQSHSSNGRVSCQGQSRNKPLHHFIYFANGNLSKRNFQRKLHQSNCSCISIGTNLLSLVISSITWALTSLQRHGVLQSATSETFQKEALTLLNSPYLRL